MSDKQARELGGCLLGALLAIGEFGLGYNLTPGPWYTKIFGGIVAFGLISTFIRAVPIKF